MGYQFFLTIFRFAKFSIMEETKNITVRQLICFVFNETKLIDYLNQALELNITKPIKRLFE